MTENSTSAERVVRKVNEPPWYEIQIGDDVANTWLQYRHGQFRMLAAMQGQVPREVRVLAELSEVADAVAKLLHAVYADG